MTLIEGDTLVKLTVGDDGHGFDPDVRADGFGLVGMRERVQLLEGAFDIDSTPGAGTTVTATFPAQRRGNGTGARTRASAAG